MIYFIGNISILQLLATTIIQRKHDIHALHIIQYIHNIQLLKYIVPMNLHKLLIIFRNWRLCIKPVTEPNRTEPTEITEHIRPNLRKLSNIRTGTTAIMIFRYRELTTLPVKKTKILKFKHLFQYLQRILCNFTAKLSLMKDLCLFCFKVSIL